MQSSSPYTATAIPGKRKWVAGAATLGLLSIGGGFVINGILNQEVNNSGSAAAVVQTKTVQSDAVQYRFGVVQLEVTATNGKIDSINELQATASPGYEQAFSYLHEYALQAQSANFDNLSGATFSTDAYKQALANALSKLNT